MYQPRSYRHWIKSQDLVPFNVVVQETDLYIRASADLSREARQLVLKYRRLLEDYIEHHPAFLTSLEPLAVPEDAPPIVRDMAKAASQVGVGPMAAVAGAMAEFVGNELSALSPEIIIENGGDIFLKTRRKRMVSIYAGKSPLSGRIGLEISGKETPLGICTSSGTVGHSLSYGQADGIVVLAKSASLADAAATAIGNGITQPGDIPQQLEQVKGVTGLKGVIIIKDSQMGVWGDIKLSQMAT
ncbi:MAG: UPF0280 family protein [Dehalococcoidia bacterium]|nr:MAG: UPF0280 family protein [Dehalococcoidia bacterium]